MGKKGDVVNKKTTDTLLTFYTEKLAVEATKSNINDLELKKKPMKEEKKKKKKSNEEAKELGEKS